MTVNDAAKPNGSLIERAAWELVYLPERSLHYSCFGELLRLARDTQAHLDSLRALEAQWLQRARDERMTDRYERSFDALDRCADDLHAWLEVHGVGV